MNRLAMMLAAGVGAAPACFTNLIERDEGIACETTANCPEDFVCDFATRQCVQLQGPSQSQCAVDSDCPLRTVCEDGSCIDGCREDGDCGLQFACEGTGSGRVGRCTDQVGTCNDQSSCRFGEVCETGSCRPYPVRAQCRTLPPFAWCMADGDCPRGVRCSGAIPGERFGQCDFCGPNASGASNGPLRTCASDSDCPGSARCFPMPCRDGSACRLGAVDLGRCTGRPYATLDATRPSDVLQSNFTQCNLGLCDPFFCGATDCRNAVNPEGSRECGRGFECYNLLADGVRCSSDDVCRREVGPWSRCSVSSEGESFCLSCRDDRDCDDGFCSGGQCIAETICGPPPGRTCRDLE
jgi:hypothetical protein